MLILKSLRLRKELTTFECTLMNEVFALGNPSPAKFELASWFQMLIKYQSFHFGIFVCFCTKKGKTKEISQNIGEEYLIHTDCISRRKKRMSAKSTRERRNSKLTFRQGVQEELHLSPAFHRDLALPCSNPPPQEPSPAKQPPCPCCNLLSFTRLSFLYLCTTAIISISITP